MLKEYDVVNAKRSIGNNIPAGSIGIILFVGTSPPGYMVEFVEDRQSLGVLTVYPEDIELVESDGENE